MMKRRKMGRKTAYFLMVIFQVLSWCQAAWAAEVVDLGRSGKTMLAKAASIQGGIPAVLGLGADEGLALIKTVAVGAGVSHERYHQTYQGIAVYGHHILISRTANGAVKGMDGRLVTGIKTDLPRRLAAAHAVKDVLSALKRSFVQFRGGGRMADWEFRNERCREVIYLDRDGTARHCFEVTFLADNGFGALFRPRMIVDAADLSIIDSYNNVQRVEAAGPGGNAKTGKRYYGEDFPFLEVTQDKDMGIMENDKVRVENNNFGYNDGVHKFMLPENNDYAANGAYCPMNDAMFFGQSVYDMYQKWFGVPPFDFKIVIGVHDLRNAANAAWLGDRAVFFDGDRSTFPLTTLDIIAHEIAHGVTQESSDLIYRFQSGGINEAYSDMAGEAAEYFLHGKTDFINGYNASKFDERMRYLYDPPKDGVSIGSAKDFTNEMDVHFSSGVFNKAYYLLSVTAGWNPQKAFEVFTLANLAYWQPSETFLTAARGAVKAAGELGCNQADVKAAFLGVDIDVGADDPVIPPVSEATVSGLSEDCLGLYFEIEDFNYSYDIYQSSVIDGDYRFIRNVEAGYATMPVYANGLAPDTVYFFKIKTITPIGKSELSEPFSGATLSGVQSPAAPAQFRYTVIEAPEYPGQFDVLFQWEAVTGADRYRLEITFDEGPDGRWAPVMETPATSVALPDFFFFMPTTLRVSAIGATGISGPSDSVAVVLSPRLDLRLTAEKRMVHEGESVTLNWKSVGAVTLTASGGWQGELDPRGSVMSAPLMHNTVFTITAVDENGKVLVDSVEVMVRKRHPFWKPLHYYRSGATVTYGETAYLCLQNHFSLFGAQPGRAPMIWTELFIPTASALPPQAPSKLVLTQASGSDAIISWQEVGVDAAYYIVSMAEAGETVFTDVIRTTETSAHIQNLEKNHIYDVKVTAVNAHGRSKDSEMIQVATHGPDLISGQVENLRHRFFTDEITGETLLELAWDEVYGAAYYLLSIYGDEKGYWRLFGTASMDTSLTFPMDLEKPFAYHIGVAAFGEQFSAALPQPTFRLVNDPAVQPRMTLTANKARVSKGESVTLRWEGFAVETVMLRENGVTETYVEAKGEFTTGPLNGDRVFEIIGRVPHGEYVIKQLFIVVDEPYAPWRQGVRYNFGDLVSYSAEHYACKWPHQSGSALRPDRHPALWQKIDD